MIVLSVGVKEIDVHWLVRLLLDIRRASSSSIELIPIEEHIIAWIISICISVVHIVVCLHHSV